MISQHSLLHDLPHDITPQELKDLMNSGQPLTLLDVRHDWEYQLCHLEGSVNVSLAHLTQNLPQLPKDELVVTICHHGVRSRQAASIFREAGFSKVTSLKGGIDAWAQQIDKSMERY